MTIWTRGSTTIRRTLTRQYALDHLFPITNTGALAYRCKILWVVPDKLRRRESGFLNVFREAGDEVLLQISREGDWVASRVISWPASFYLNPFPAIAATVQFVTGPPRVRRRGHRMLLEHGGSTVFMHTIGIPLLYSWTKGVEL